MYNIYDKIWLKEISEEHQSLWWFTKEQNHNCECDQLETVEHILKECPLHPVEREVLRKVSPELDLKILLDTKKGLNAVVKFLDERLNLLRALTPLLCQSH